MSTLHTVRFTGRYCPGRDPLKVQARFQQAFSVTAEQATQVFAGDGATLKRNLSPDEAARLLNALELIGMEAEADPPLPREATEFSAPAGAEPSAEPRTLPFEFHGQGGEFFRIWIVNLLLTILTLGIYSAWAKVRTNAYFYRNTRLDGAAFDYLANPRDILKGRFIAGAIFVVYSVIGEIHPLLAIVAALLLFVATPWLVMKSMRFRLKNTAWRNVPFRFTGDTRGAAEAFIGGPLVAGITLGLAAPFAFFKQHAYLIANSSYGNGQMRFSATLKQYFGACYRAALGVFAAAVAAMLLLRWFAPLGALAFTLTFLLAIAWFQVLFANLRFNHLQIGDHRLAADWSLRSFFPLVVTNTLFMVLTLGIFYPWARVRTAHYAAAHTRLIAAGALDDFTAGAQVATSAIGEEAAGFFDVEFGL